MVNKKWNPRKIYNNSFKWINNQSNREFMFDQSLQEVELYLQGQELKFGYGSLVGCLYQISFWYRKCFVVDIFKTNGQFPENIYFSFQYNLWRALILSAYYATDDRLNNPPWLSFNEQGLTLAIGITLGQWKESKRLGRLILLNFKNNEYSALYGTKLGPFIIKLFTDWENLSIPQEYEKEFDELPECYSNLLSNWRVKDFSLLEKSFLQACDFHIERSYEHSQYDVCEFEEEAYSIFPVEILAVLRLRESLGLEIGEINHPLMQTPTAKLFPIIDPPCDEMLECLKEKVSKELNIFSY